MKFHNKKFVAHFRHKLPSGLPLVGVLVFVWGDTVNTASRMESHGEAGRVHVSEEVFSALQGKFTFEERGEMDVKGKSLMRTWFLVNANG